MSVLIQRLLTLLKINVDVRINENIKVFLNSLSDSCNWRLYLKSNFFKIVEIKEGHPIFCYSYNADKCINDNAILKIVTIREFSGDLAVWYNTSEDYNKANKIVWMLENMNRQKKLPANKLEYGVVPMDFHELVGASTLKNNVYYQLDNQLYFIKNSINQYYASSSFENLPTKANLEDPKFLAKAKGMSIIDCDSHTFLAWFNRSVYTFSKDQLRNPICS